MASPSPDATEAVIGATLQYLADRDAAARRRSALGPNCWTGPHTGRRTRTTDTAKPRGRAT